MSEITGEYIDSVIDGQERKFYIKPDLFTDYVMNKLSAYIKGERRRNRQEMLKDLEASGLPSEAISSSIGDIVKDSVSKPFIGYEEAAMALESADGTALCIALVSCCDEIPDEAFARKVLAGCGSVLGVIEVIIGSGKQPLEAAEKN